MGFGTIFTTITFIIVFVAMTVTIVNTQKNMAESAITIKEQQLELVKQEGQEIEITSTSYANGVFLPWVTTYEDEFLDGTFVNTTTAGDQLEIAANNLTSTYTSEEYDTGSVSNYTTLTWNAVIPGLTRLAFQIRTGDNLTDLQAANFLGPDATVNTYYNVTGTYINETHNLSQFIQWRAYLNTSVAATTPELQDLTINIERGAGNSVLQIDNVGEEKLDFENTDVYIDGIRVERSEAYRHFDYETISDTRLWNPGEELNITVFADLSGATTITVTNEYAKDQAVVTP